ncbi:MAG: hypothetical protein WA584_07100 [Pyrinomonadaceae bacterium]
MAVSKTEAIGFADQFRQFLQDNKQALSEKGLDVTNWITDAESQKNDAVLQIGKQDEMQTAAKAQTKVADAAVDLLYSTTSSRLDAAMGVLGKNTPLAKQAGKLRSGINKQYKKKQNTGGDK